MLTNQHRKGVSLVPWYKDTKSFTQKSLLTTGKCFSHEEKWEKGPLLLRGSAPDLRLTFLESSCNFRKFGIKKNGGYFFQLDGSSGPMCIRLNECVSWIKMKNLLNFHLPLHLRHCPSDMTLGSSQARSAVFLLTRGGVCGTGEPINGSFIWHNGRIERK